MSEFMFSLSIEVKAAETKLGVQCSKLNQKGPPFSLLYVKSYSAKHVLYLDGSRSQNNT